MLTRPIWLGGVVVSVSDSWSKGRGFDSQPAHRQATTLGKLLTPTCLCSPSSIIWYLVRAFMLTCRMWLPVMGPMNNGSIVIVVLKRSRSYRIRDINYMLYFYFTKSFLHKCSKNLVIFACEIHFCCHNFPFTSQCWWCHLAFATVFLLLLLFPASFLLSCHCLVIHLLQRAKALRVFAVVSCLK